MYIFLNILILDDNYEFNYKKKITPNIFDSLFTIRQIGKNKGFPKFYDRERHFFSIDVKIRIKIIKIELE